MSISAIVVHYLTPNELAASLESLRIQSSPPAEVVVVDNSAAQASGTRAVVDSAAYMWHPAPGNLGFGSACNLGAEQVSGSHFLFMNADVTLAPDACRMLLARAERDANVAVVGPRLLGRDGRLERSARTFPTLKTGMLGRSSLLTKVLASTGRVPPELATAHGPPGGVDWVSGACMLVRRSAFEEVGGFDENYWMYWEDADLCRRLKNAGWQAFFEPSAEARHATGSSGACKRTIKAFHASAALYAERHIFRTSLGRWLCRVALMARMHFVLVKHNVVTKRR